MSTSTATTSGLRLPLKDPRLVRGSSVGWQVGLGT